MAKRKKSILFALSNEGREIAAFEEETLALRRELQEARASRTLAENHAAKCVNFAVSSSVTPVTFDTPCITSTPVRTALSDTRSLSPPLSTISSQSSSAPFILHSHSTEAATLLVSETADQHQGIETDTDTTLREEPVWSTEDEGDWYSETTSAFYPTMTCTDTIDLTQRNQELMAEIDDTFWELFTADWIEWFETYKVNIARKGKAKSLIREEIQTKISTGISEKQFDAQLSRIWKRIKANVKSRKKDETEIDALLNTLEEQEEEEDLSDGDMASRRERSIDHASWQRSGEFPNQRSSFKKSWQKKSSMERSFSEADKSDECQDTMILVDSSSSSAINHGMTNEDEDYLSDERTSQAITEVPDVAVVSGGCIVPKDFCSTKPLTSRTQTAPSRATAFTYTTAFI